MPYTYDYPRAAMTVDNIMVNRQKKILLVKRKDEPFKGKWAIPGGFLHADKELIKDAAEREPLEETKVKPKGRFWTYYDAIDRDPRDRVITMVFVSFIKEDVEVEAGDDAAEAQWFSLIEIEQMEDLAFDHRQILDDFLSEFVYN